MTSHLKCQLCANSLNRHRVWWLRIFANFLRLPLFAMRRSLRVPHQVQIALSEMRPVRDRHSHITLLNSSHTTRFLF